MDRTGHLVDTLNRHDVPNLSLRGDGVILANIAPNPAGAAERTGQVIAPVTDAVVTLTGSLTLHGTVGHATDVAGPVAGVIAVRNRLRYDLVDLMITGF